MKKILVGQITNAHGIQGMLKVYPYTDDSERFFDLKEIYIGNESTSRAIESVSIQKKIILLKVEGIEDRNHAERLKGTNLFIDRKDRKELSEDEFFISDLTGIDVINFDTLENLGVIESILSQAGNDILVVKTENNEIMIPFVKAFIKKISIEEREIHVKLIEGMLP